MNATLPLLLAALLGADDLVQFNRDVRPILAEARFQCHGPDEGKRKAELRLDQETSVFLKRDDHHVVVAGDVEKSELIARVATEDATLKMPPPESGKILSPQQVDILRRWVKQGAKWQKHWSLIS